MIFSTHIIGNMNVVGDILQPLECRARTYYPAVVLVVHVCDIGVILFLSTFMLMKI